MTGTGFFQVAVDGAQIFRKRLRRHRTSGYRGHTHAVVGRGTCGQDGEMNTVSEMRDVPVFAEDLWPICIDKRGISPVTLT